MVSEAQKRAARKYDAAHTVQVCVKLNTKTEADILARLDEVANDVRGKQGYIKKLIREDIARRQ